MLKKIIFLIIIICAIYFYSANRTISHGPGVVAPESPKQTNTQGLADINHKDYTLTPRAVIRFEARVLSVVWYDDKYSEVMPLDVVFSWGPMSDERNLKKIMTRQSDRTMRWSMTTPPMEQIEMIKHSANMHLIPSSEMIMEQLEDIRKGNIVTIEGYLVDTRSATEGWKYKTSLKRDDRGEHSSEVVWIKSLNIR